MDDEVKLWYDFLSREKEDANRLRRYTWTLLLPCLATIGWILTRGDPAPIDLWAIVGIPSLLFSIGILQAGARRASKKNEALNEIQLGIVRGTLKNTQQIAGAFDKNSEIITTSLSQYWHNRGMALLEKRT